MNLTSLALPLIQNLGIIPMGSFLFSVLFGFTRLQSSFGQDQILSKEQLTPQLPIRDINIIVLTDVHSWVMGQGRHDTNLNANYGHVLSFYEKLKALCNSKGADLFLMNNGDVVDGTGLSTYPPNKILPIVKQMPYDAMTIGNHELYHEASVRYMQESGYFEFWGGHYLTSNTFDSETGDHLANKFIFLEGKETNSTILTLGFLYNMMNNCEITTVQSVQETVESEWFIEVLEGVHGSFDAIVVLAHMDAEDELVRVILGKIRVICGERMPVQFLTGHSHLRKNNPTDAFSSSFEAGHYLDTIGFVSFDLPSSNLSMTNMTFHHEFIDADVALLTELIGEDSLLTISGRELSKLIHDTEVSLGILEVIGCDVPMTYHLKNGIDKPDSLWRLFLKRVVPEYLFDGAGENQLFIANTGAWRYDLSKGNVTINDLISVSPYNDTLCVVGENILGSEFIAAFGLPNLVNSTKFGELPQLAVAGNVIPTEKYKVYSITFDCEHISRSLANITGREFMPTQLVEPTTTGLWYNFIVNEWKCPLSEERNWKDIIGDFFSDFTVLKIIAFVLTFCIIIMYGWMFICRRGHRQLTGLDDLSLFDDSAVAELTSDEEDMQDNPSNNFPLENKVKGPAYQSLKNPAIV